MTKSGIASILGTLLILGCAAGQARAQTTEDENQTQSVTRSGMLEATPGFTGSKLGIEVEEVEIVGGDLQAIDLRVPFGAPRVDRIEIEAANGKVIELPREAEIEPGSDPFSTDIRVFLPRRQNLQFRIRIIDLPDD